MGGFGKSLDHPIDSIKKKWTEFGKWVESGGNNPVNDFIQGRLFAWTNGYAGVKDKPKPLSTDKEIKPLAQDEIIRHLMSKGMSRDNAISIAANIQAESGNRPFVSNGNAYGYGQHMPDRQRVFKDQFGKNYKESTPEEQLDFIVYELTEGMYKSVGKKLKNMSPSEGAKLLNDKYEVSASDPATLAKHANERARMAEQLAGSSPNINNVPATTTNSNSTTYGQIVVYTQATDAQGIANALPRALANQSESGAF